MTTPLTTTSRTATAAHTEPTVMGKLSDVSGDTIKVGLGWDEASGTVELRQDGSGTNSPEPSTSVQAKGMRVINVLHVFTSTLNMHSYAQMN